MFAFFFFLFSSIFFLIIPDTLVLFPNFRPFSLWLARSLSRFSPYSSWLMLWMVKFPHWKFVHKCVTLDFISKEKKETQKRHHQYCLLCVCVYVSGVFRLLFFSTFFLRIWFFSVFKWFTFCVLSALFFFLSFQLYLQHLTIQRSVRLFSMTLLKVEPTAIGLLCIFGCWCSLLKIFYHRQRTFAVVCVEWKSQWNFSYRRPKVCITCN